MFIVWTLALDTRKKVIRNAKLFMINGREKCQTFDYLASDREVAWRTLFNSYFVMYCTDRHRILFVLIICEILFSVQASCASCTEPEAKYILSMGAANTKHTRYDSTGAKFDTHEKRKFHSVRVNKICPPDQQIQDGECKTASFQ